MYCGSSACQQCKGEEKPLAKHPELRSKVADYPHYLLPDTNVVLHQVCMGRRRGGAVGFIRKNLGTEDFRFGPVSVPCETGVERVDVGERT